MMRRSALAAAVLLGLGLGGALVVRHAATPTTPAGGSAPARGDGAGPAPDPVPGLPAADASATQPAGLSADNVRILPGTHELLEGLNDPSQPPERDLEIIAEALAQYRRVFGRNPPGGDNPEIVAALRGRNSRKLAVIPPGRAAVDAAGAMTDRWGTPFHFHPVSGSVTEVVSAGPDRLLWTADDVGTLTPVDGPVPP